MIVKQRLALAISAALSVTGGVGCSTISGGKATSASTPNGKVVVHYVSFSGARQRQYKQSNFVDSSSTERLLKEIQLDAEIDALAKKLGLGSYAVNDSRVQKKAPTRIQKRIHPQIRRATYNNRKTKNRKIVMRKAVATRRKISIAHQQPTVSRQVSKRALAKPIKPNVSKVVVTSPKISLAYRQPTVSRQISKRALTKPVKLSAFEREVNRLYSDKKSERSVQQTSRNSLWARITTGYRLSSDNEKSAVQKFLDYHAQNPAHLNRIFKHSGKYLHFILQELNKRRMPTELALLPMVESAYNNDLKSNTGAVGLWQFKANEGSQLGLRQTRTYDARLDVYASTRAALNQLQSLNHRFNGDWALTLASYKEGVKKVQREMLRNRYLRKPADFWHLNLSKQTQDYIAKLLAYREILLRPHAYNLTLPVVTTSPKIMQVVVNKAVNLKKVALAADLPISTLAELNRNFKNGITNPHLSKKIVLPRRYASKLHRLIRQQSPIITASYKPQKKTKRYTIAKKAKSAIHLVNYSIKKDESLYKIALKHGTTVAKIMRLNGMQNTHIKAGENLKIALKTSATPSS